eukprot:CAMPEP_0171190496 /NCGR_PEP_ID=MMETSP0790-20130122/18885_1 /TAXON_ID=2925 /ORGANISM="Alexandrium catenella, Strain OF101" /LENGTH=88 /DNA_ID=CAMNT_0011655627 /DNA_START=445 /DNA_END=711 /DNA_ORIENTATION=+
MPTNEKPSLSLRRASATSSGLTARSDNPPQGNPGRVNIRTMQPACLFAKVVTFGSSRESQPPQEVSLFALMSILHLPGVSGEHRRMSE